jgi:hypothetical protein
MPGLNRRGFLTASAAAAAGHDAGLYLGQPAADRLVAEPAIYLDPAYWAEPHRRNALWPVGVRVNLNTYRQQQPPGFPLGVQQVAPAC